MRKSCILTIALLAVVATIVGPSARGENISMKVGTVGNEPAWMVSLDGKAWYDPFTAAVPPGVTAIGIQKELKGLDSTTFNPEPAIGGLDLTFWNGMWVGKYNFFIPNWAGDIRFHLNAARVDDKAAILINGFTVGYFALDNKTGPGTFQFADDPDTVLDVNYVSSLHFPTWGSDQKFKTGWNSIEVFMNNTDDPNKDLFAPPITDIYGTKLYTYLSLDATVTYVPEPQAWILLLTVAGFLVVSRVRARG